MPIKTFAEACKKLKLSPVKVLPKVMGMQKKHHKAAIAYAKLLIIAEALNEGWEPNWDDSNEWKYWPWFYMDSPGFRFYDSFFSLTFSCTTGGSRLCFRTRDLSDHAGKTFLPLWKDMMVLPKKAKPKAASKKK